MSAGRVDPDDLPRLGSLVGRYRLDALLGRGGMGVVFRATDMELQRPVAIKFLSPEFTGDAVFRERFVRESRLAAAIEHPAIVPIYEAGTLGDALFIAMRFVPGQDLGRILRAAAPLDPVRVRALLSPIADALDAAHRRGLVHRDVKPGNILVEQDTVERALLTDFGLSRRAGDRTIATLHGPLGTIDYIAPEQVRGETLDGRADQYALACVVVHCLIGRAPFEADSDAAVLHAQLTLPPPSLHEWRPDLPTAVDAVVARGLSKDPAGRFPDCAAFMAALTATLEPGADQAGGHAGAGRGTGDGLLRSPSSRSGIPSTAGTPGGSHGTQPSPSAAIDVRSRASSRRRAPLLLGGLAVLGVITLAGSIIALSGRPAADTGVEGSPEPSGSLAATLGLRPGEVIIFASDRGGDYDLYAMGAEDERPRLLRGTPRDERLPAISPDGRTIAYVVGNEPFRDIWLADIDGGSPRRLTTHPTDDTDPAWSADGTSLAFASQRSDSQYDIWEIRERGSGLDEANARNLTEHPLALEHQPTWLPDSPDLVIASNYYGGHRDLVRIEPGQVPGRRLTNSEDYDFEPDVSPDGSSIVFYRREYCETCPAFRGPSDLFVVDVDGSHPRRLTRTSGRDEISPAWSPDGRAIVYAATSGDVSGLFLASADGGRRRPFAEGSPGAVDPAWGIVGATPAPIAGTGDTP